ncbi:MAG: response regulator [Chloroflexi bacterium]|nr:response regulator [Chloroflexota bacterium]
MSAKSIVILLAEDDPDDRYLISEALDETRLSTSLYVVENGEELLDYLTRHGAYSDPEKWPLPNLILLDLNMPRKDGREVLAEIKARPELRRIPIVVLTTSHAEEDILRTYELGVSGFITKPVSFNDLLDIMKAIETYWLRIVQLPPM